MRCPNCRKKIDDEEVLCPHCGEHISKHRERVKEKYGEGFINNSDFYVEELPEEKVTNNRKNTKEGIIGFLICIVVFVSMLRGMFWFGEILSEEINKTDNEVVEVKPEYETGTSLLEQLDIFNPNKEEGYNKALKAMQQCIDKLGFDGYQSNGTTIDCLDFSDDDTNQKTMTIVYSSRKRDILYQNNYINNFSQLSMDEMYNKINWMFNIEMDKEDFIATVYEYIQTTKHLQNQEINVFTAYEDSNTIVKIAQFNDNGQHVIAFKCTFKVEITNIE